MLIWINLATAICRRISGPGYTFGATPMLAQLSRNDIPIPMQTRTRRFVSSWIAIAAILLNTLMPAVSSALGSTHVRSESPGSDWVEICSNQEMAWVRVAPDGHVLERSSQSPAGAPATDHSIHCPYCLTHAASFGLPPPSVFVLPIWTAPPELLASSLYQGRSFVTWYIPAVRAPPTSL